MHRRLGRVAVGVAFRVGLALSDTPREGGEGRGGGVAPVPSQRLRRERLVPPPAAVSTPAAACGARPGRTRGGIGRGVCRARGSGSVRAPRLGCVGEGADSVRGQVPVTHVQHVLGVLAPVQHRSSKAAEEEERGDVHQHPVVPVSFVCEETVLAALDGAGGPPTTPGGPRHGAARASLVGLGAVEDLPDRTAFAV